MSDLTSDTPPPGTHTLTYTGRTGEIFSLFLSNLFLTIISLGIYRFWGKARMRRYLWSHTLFQNEPFGYAGNGKELFKGFLKVLFLMFIPALLIWQAIAMLTVAAFESLSILLLVSFLSPYLIFVVRRYRLNRSDWRCIRFNQTGSPRTYMLMSIRGWILNILTLGLYVPYNAARLFDYQINHICFGTLSFSHAGNARDFARAYRRIWFAMLFLTLLGLGALGGTAVSIFTAIKASHKKILTELHDPHVAFLFLLPVFVLWILMLCLFMARLKYRLLIYRHVAATTSLGDMRAEFTATFWQFFRLKMGNFFLKLISLGLLSPIATHRRMKFMCRHLKFQGVPSFASINQIPSLGKSGEGWMHWFDIDALDF